MVFVARSAVYIKNNYANLSEQRLDFLTAFLMLSISFVLNQFDRNSCLFSIETILSWGYTAQHKNKNSQLLPSALSSLQQWSTWIFNPKLSKRLQLDCISISLNLIDDLFVMVWNFSRQLFRSPNMVWHKPHHAMFFFEVDQ